MSSDARKPTPPARPVGIKDIARELGVSIGTVNRALHGKPGINAMTRARVLEHGRALGYRPNLAARYLKSRKPIRISVHLPRRDRAVLGFAARGHPRSRRAIRCRRCRSSSRAIRDSAKATFRFSSRPCTTARTV